LKLWSAQAISALGSRIMRTALPILAVLSAVTVAPGVLVGLAIGGRVDRRAKRPPLMGAGLGRPGPVLALPPSVWLGRLRMGHLYLVAALGGAATTLFQIADNAYLPALIGKDRLIEGNSKLESTEAVAEIIGPGLGGILVQAITAPLAIVFDSLSFLASALLLGAIRREESSAPEGLVGDPPSLMRDVRVGLRASVGHPIVGPEFLVEALSSITGGFFLSLYTLYALKALQLSAGALGVIISVGGLGALMGTALAGRMSRRLGLGPALIVCLGGSRLAGLLIPLARGPEWLAVTCLVGHQLLGDVLLVSYFVLATSVRHVILPQEILVPPH